MREAAGLASKDLARNAGRLQEVLADVADQAGAFELVCGQDAKGEPRRPFSFLTCTVLSSAGGAPVEEFLLIPFGEVRVERPAAGDSFVFTRRHAESAKRWFDTMGRRLAIDYEHQSFDRFNTRADGLRPAAGWIGGLEIREDGLWAIEVTWTERAAELLRAGEYRYFSPVILWTDEDRGDVAALGPVALTNDPAMRGVQPLAAARRNDGADLEDGPERDVLRADADRVLASDLHLVPREELEAAQAEVALLKTELATQEADAFVERGMRLGKIVDSTSMDWREDYLLDPEATEARLQRAPALLPPGRVLTLSRRGEVEPLRQGEREYRRHLDVYRRWGVDPEDLAAYQRAVAGGRVVQNSVGK